MGHGRPKKGKIVARIVSAEQLSELTGFLIALEEPLGRFDQHKLHEVQQGMDLLMRTYHQLESVRTGLMANCPHPFETTRIENHYETARCDWCRIVLRSHPLPGVQWDTD